MANNPTKHELVWSNRILMSVCVGLALFAGYLWIEPERAALRRQIVVAEPQSLAVQESQMPWSTKEREDMFLSLLLENAPSYRFTPEAISQDAALTLAWAAHGEVGEYGQRSYASLKNEYPLELWLLVERVEGMKPGLYQYLSQTQTLSYRPDKTADEIVRLMKLSVNEVLPPMLWLIAVPIDSLSNREQLLAEAGLLEQTLTLTAKSMGLGVLPFYPSLYSPGDVTLLMGDDVEVLRSVVVGYRAPGE
jgi:hypothetical protein